MNRHAVNDLIECSLQRWYRVVSEWRSPAEGTAAGCVSCRESEFASFDRDGYWPHDLIHEFVEELGLVSLQLARDLHEERHCEVDVGFSTALCGDCSSCARAIVNAGVLNHARDIADVINECAMPRLAVYVQLHTNLALDAATRGEWAS